MLKFFSKYRLQFSILAVIIGLLLLMIQTHSNKENSNIQSAIQTFTYPIQASVHSFASSIKEFWSNYLFLIEVNYQQHTIFLKYILFALFVLTLLIDAKLS